jgi:hypothetical protein
MSKAVRRLHRELTRQISKYATRLYLREGWHENSPEDERPSRDHARFLMRNGHLSGWSDYAWAVLEEYGLERLDGLNRDQEAGVISKLVEDFKVIAEESARKPIEELEADVFGERSAI